jgi:hypothetical protein
VRGEGRQQPHQRVDGLREQARPLLGGHPIQRLRREGVHGVHQLVEGADRGVEVELVDVRRDALDGLVDGAAEGAPRLREVGRPGRAPAMNAADAPGRSATRGSGTGRPPPPPGRSTRGPSRAAP